MLDLGLTRPDYMNPKQLQFNNKRGKNNMVLKMGNGQRSPSPLSKIQSKTMLLSTLLKRGFTPTLKSINQFLYFLSKIQRYTFITHFFSQLHHNQIKGNSQTHSIVTLALLKLNKFEEAEHFIKTHISKSSKFSRGGIWDSLIQGFCTKRKNPEKGLLILQECLENYGILPSSFSFCSLIYGFSSQGKMSGAIEVLELMNDEKVKYPYDNFVCSSVISGFCKIGKPELAMEFFEIALQMAALRPNVVAYTAIVSALCMSGRVSEVRNLVCRMEKEGLGIDVVFYSSWICGYLREELLMEAFQKHREMVEEGINPDVVSYTILIDKFVKEGNVEKAAGFLDKMRASGLKPDLVTYTAIVLGLCKKGKMDEAFAVFKLVEGLGIELDEFIYAILIDGVCRKGDFDRVYQLLEEMDKKGISPSIITYNTLINGLCKTGRTCDADEVSERIQGDIVTYSTLLHGYIEEEDVTRILAIKQRSEEAGVGMDIVMFNILLKALFMIGAFEDVYARYKGMQEMDLVANSVTYCTMIDGYCQVGKINEALEIFDEFRRTSISSVACYNCMINGLCKNGMVDVATEVFIELNQKGLTLDLGICMMLIKAVVKEEGADGVLNLIYKTENVGFDFYDTICNFAISFLCKRKFPVAATKVSMVVRRNCLGLTSMSYYSILEALIGDGKLWLSQPFLSVFIKEYGMVEPKVGKILLHYLCLKDINSAFYFFNKMKDKNIALTFPVSALKTLIKTGRVLAAYELVMRAKDNLPGMNVVNYTIIVDGLCKEGHPIKALDLCAFAEKKGIIFNIITYNSVINGLCHQGCLVEAFRLFDSFERNNLCPSEITYGTLIDNLCKEGYLMDAKQLFERMVLKGYKANTHIFNSFLTGYCKFGQIEEALKFLINMEIKGLDPDEFTISSVINGYCQNGDMEGALRFYFEYKRKGVSPDFLGFLCLIRGLCAKGRMEEARTMLREMLQSQSVMELINRVNTEVEAEPVESFLVFLCEQGSIKEAVTVLNEISSIYFPLRKWYDPYADSYEPYKVSELECISSLERPDLDFASSDVLRDKMVEISDDLGKGSHFNHFDSYYSLVASLCQRGELLKANRLAKIMLASLDGDC